VPFVGVVIAMVAFMLVYMATDSLIYHIVAGFLSLILISNFFAQAITNLLNNSRSHE